MIVSITIHLVNHLLNFIVSLQRHYLALVNLLNLQLCTRVNVRKHSHILEFEDLKHFPLLSKCLQVPTLSNFILGSIL